MRPRTALTRLFLPALFTLALTAHPAAPQSTTAPGQWTWMTGSNSIPVTSCRIPGLCGQPGVYGTLGTANPANTPGGRWQASTWTDSTGKLWLFGGMGIDSTGAFADINDLWEFDPASSEWTWMAGSSTGAQDGVYGTLGTPSASNIPSAREGAATWVDNLGNLWLFGGTDHNGGSVNDLWKYSPSTGEWTWVSGTGQPSGDCPGVYGVLGTAATGNVPGGRSESASWSDKSGNLWMFGGNGCASTNYVGNLNDLWMFSPTTSEWTWMGGSSSNDQPTLDGAAGVYGTLGTPDPANMPGAHWGSATWADANGNFWFFGGFGVDSAGNGGTLNDLWKYSPSANEWTWMGGSSTKSTSSDVYGKIGVAAVGNYPAGRLQTASWRDPGGKFWLFGGNGFGSIDSLGDLNDLWSFDPSAGLWTCEAANSGTSYGTLGVSAAGNQPGARSGLSSWVDSNGNPWIFGGLGADSQGYHGYLNDLWEYVPVAPPPTFDPPAGTYTGAQSITISDAAPNATIYYTTDGSAPGTNSTQYSGPISVTTSETLNAIAVAPGYGQSPAGSAAYKIIITPTITWAAPAAIAYGTALSASQLDATTSLPGTFTYNPPAGTVLGVGSQTLYATFTPTDSADYTTATASVTLTVNPATPVIALTSSANPSTVAQFVTFTAAVTSSAGTPTGSVTFWDGTTQLGSGTLASGSATYATSTLAAGSHSITAQYSGDSNFTPVTSAALTQTVSALSVGPAPGAPTTANITPGGTANFALSVTPPGNNPVNLSVTGLPTGATSSFSPNPIPAGAGPTNVQFVINLPGQASSAVPQQTPFNRMPLALGLLLLPFLGLRRVRRGSRFLLIAILAIAGAAGLAGLAGCGSHNFNNGPTTTPTPQGAYTLTVTATAGTTTQTTTLILNVQ